MDGSKAELKVGITVLVALGIFLGGLFWLKGFYLAESRYRCDVWFPNVGTLGVGDPVAVSGVTKGKVAEIDLYEGGVRVGLDLANDVALRSDAVFTIKNIGLMGERFVDVYTGTARDSLPHDPLPRGTYETGIPEVMGLLGGMTEDVRELVRAIRSTIGSDSTMAQIARISAGLEEMTREATALIAEHRATVGRTVEDLGSVAASLRQTIDDNSGRVTETLARMDSASVRLSIFAARLDTLAVEAHAVIDDLQHGEGTLPRLLHDDQLLQRWEATASELDALVADIRKNPGKYLKLKFSLF